jgi:DNA-binding NarL/FixJ family response regulator
MTVSDSTSCLDGRLRGILVVDDHELVRLGLRTLVQSHAQSLGREVLVFDARSLEEALSCYAAHADQVDLVLLDLHLPDTHGLSGLSRFVQCHPGARVVILSGDTNPGLAQESMALGAQHFLAKSGDLKWVVEYLHSMTTWGADQVQALTAGAATDATLHREVRTPSGETVALTARQAQILDWLLSGLSNRDIAQQAQLSEGTVKNHVSALLLLLGVRSRAQLISSLR